MHNLALPKNHANYTPLTPLGFLQRVARVYAERPALIHNDTVTTWTDLYARCRQLASALAAHGVQPGDTVSVIAPNVPALFEAHYAVPMCGAVLNAINVRLDAATIAFILEHSEARVLLTDSAFSEVVAKALNAMKRAPLVIDICDNEEGLRLGAHEYESLLATGDTEYHWQPPQDEWQALSLNYTSGTTGNPKGVVYHHRGAYLNALSNALGWNMTQQSVYLWTLPMFHCNGWCFPWTLAALGCASVCMRRVDAAGIFTAIHTHGVTHFCGAPIILNLLLNATAQERRPLPGRIAVMTAAAPPPASVLAAMEQMGFDMTHVYGLTETYGPATICAWRGEWDELPADKRASLKARQGVPYHVLEGLEVMDADGMTNVTADSAHLGEVMLRGNIVMKGYLKNRAATEEAMRGGWFHSGDLAVMHADRYIQLKDRAKDIIISGGENISSIEIEDVLYRHPAVLAAAVVARPDNKWGETPCAFVTLKPSVATQKAAVSDAELSESSKAATTEKSAPASAKPARALGKSIYAFGKSASAPPSEEQLIAFCRRHLAHYKAPRTIVFCELPKTSTGKIQKFKLRAVAERMGSL